MIHIVFQQADVAALQKSFDLDEMLRGEIILIADDYAVGPLANPDNIEGLQARAGWWKQLQEASNYPVKLELTETSDVATVEQLRNHLSDNPEVDLWIWAAQNKHDVSGYYWLMPQLKQFQGRVYILYLNNLPFINEKGHLFYPVNLFEISAREFVKAKKLSRVITSSEFEVDPDEWIRLLNENKGVRTLEGGKKLAQHDYDYYDNELLSFITPDWQKGSKVLHAFFSKGKITTGDVFILWRIKTMIDSGKIDSQGDMKNPKEFEIKLKASEGNQ